MKHVLVTGGAGFIGSHLADELLLHGYRVRVLDNLSVQVHGADRKRPGYLSDEVELIVDDIRNPEAVRRALRGIDAVYHLVAMVGVGQSMYEVVRYTDVNNVGTAILLEALIERQVERLVVASSMSVYGEGLYQGPDGTVYSDVQRNVHHLRLSDWEIRNRSGELLHPIPTPESKPPSLESVYALSKYDQERLCMIAGRAYRMSTVALRFFNVYGPNQALSNPYTGVLAIFASRLLNGKQPLIFEDGRQQRDFVSVYDIARACRLALEVPGACGKVLNIGSGEAMEVRTVAEQMAKVLGKRIAPEIVGKYRIGDIRHCFPDISLAHDVLGYTPTVNFADGVLDFAAWLDGQVAHDRVAEASAQTERARAVGVNGMKGLLGGRDPRSETRPVLITGGAGFIGTNVAERLLAAGRRVVVLDNLSRAGVDQNALWLQQRYGRQIKVIVGDVRDPGDLRRALEDVEHVFHFAAQVAVTSSLLDPRTDYEINATGTLNLLEAIRALDRPPSLIYTSTNKVYGSLEDLVLRREDDRWVPVDRSVADRGIPETRHLDFETPYGCSKGAAEQYVLDYARSFALDAVVFRMSCIYGPHQFGTEDQGWVAHFVKRALEGRSITLYGDGFQVRDILNARDLVEAFFVAWERIGALSGQAFNIGGGNRFTVSLLEVVDVISAIMGRPPTLHFDSARKGDQRYFVSDTSKFQAATGWKPQVTPRAGIRQLYEWLLSAHSIETQEIVAS